MNVRTVSSSFLAILLLAVVGCIDAAGNVEYFNVSKALVHQGETITFTCGATRERDDDGQIHSLTVHLRKWFKDSAERWLLAVNEEVEERDDPRYRARLNRKGEVREVEFTISDAEPGDTGHYTCYTDREKPNITVVVNVLSKPQTAVLSLDSVVVGRIGFEHLPNKSSEQKTVNLGHSYVVNCVIEGGNPAPNVTLASGGMPYQGVVVTQQTQRNPRDRMSAPWHVMNATLHWTPTVHHIAQPFVCSAGIENERDIWTDFVPMLDETNRAPIFACHDKVELKPGDNNLAVPCRVISLRDSLSSIKVRIYEETGKNFTIQPELRDHRTEKTYEDDRRYMVTVEPRPLRLKSWNVTLTVKDSPTIADLQKVEFVADTEYEQGIHVISIEIGASSRITVSMATLLVTMVLGAFCRP